MRVRIEWVALILVLSACAPPADKRQAGEGGQRLFVWTTDSDSVDLNFLAVLDADPRSSSYGDVLHTLPVPTAGRVRGHHTEHRMPEGGHLFANDFGTGKTYVLDLREPSAPAVADSFSAAGPLMSPHSFERLPNGNVLATFKMRVPAILLRVAWPNWTRWVELSAGREALWRVSMCARTVWRW